MSLDLNDTNNINDLIILNGYQRDDLIRIGKIRPIKIKSNNKILLPIQNIHEEEIEEPVQSINVVETDIEIDKLLTDEYMELLERSKGYAKNHSLKGGTIKETLKKLGIKPPKGNSKKDDMIDLLLEEIQKRRLLKIHTEPVLRKPAAVIYAIDED